MADAHSQNGSAKEGSPRPLLRRLDQAAVASLIALALGSMGVYWFAKGGHRGQLIEIDRAEPLSARYLVDINMADWPEQTSLKLLGNLVFKAADLREIPHDSRATPGIDRAELLLGQLLARGPMSHRAIIAKGRRAGLSRASFYRAKRRLGIIHDAGCWTLPAAMTV